MDMEILFYVIVLIVGGGWLNYKVRQAKRQYMSDDWMRGTGL